MKLIETEKATERWDLPHALELANAQKALCRCERPAEHELHRPVILEQASHREMIVTEKGI